MSPLSVSLAKTRELTDDSDNSTASSSYSDWKIPKMSN